MNIFKTKIDGSDANIKNKESKILYQILNSLTKEQEEFLKKYIIETGNQQLNSYIKEKLGITICQNKVSLDENIIFHLWNINFSNFLKQNKIEISLPEHKANLDYLPNLIKFFVYYKTKESSLNAIKQCLKDKDLNFNISKIPFSDENEKFKLIFVLLFFYSLNYSKIRIRERNKLKNDDQNIKKDIEKTKKEFLKNIHYIILKYQAYIISGEKKVDDIFGIRKKPTKLNKIIPFKKEKLKEGELFRELQQELINFQKRLNKDLNKYKVLENQKELFKQPEFIALAEMIASITALFDGGIILTIFNGIALIYYFATKDNEKCELLEKLQEIEIKIKGKIDG